MVRVRITYSIDAEVLREWDKVVPEGKRSRTLEKLMQEHIKEVK